MHTDYFPLGVASGEGFCNRVNERHWLLTNFKENAHSLIMSPRRYGKTSLVLKAISLAQHPYIQIDFFSSRNIEDIEKEIIKKVGEGLARIMPPSQKFLELIKSTMQYFQASLMMQHSGLSIGLQVTANREPHQNIEDILLGLEKMGEKTNKIIIIFMDEFQEVSNIAEVKAVEGTIRRVAQETKFLRFVFSGSNRHLLSQMFEDSNKPFYLLCEKLKLERIHEKDYLAYINHAAEKRWNKTLEVEVIKDILTVTERHPHYVNRLCRRLWLEAKPPGKDDVYRTWRQYTAEEVSQVAQDIAGLSDNQRRLLITLSRESGVSKPTSQEFSKKANMAVPSIRQALEVLVKQDFVFITEIETYQVLDPVIQVVLSQ